MEAAKDELGRVILAGTMTKSYLPKEKVGKPSAWATFYTLLAYKERRYYWWYVLLCRKFHILQICRYA